MAYGEIEHRFNSISDKDIESIAENNDNKVILNEKVKFVRNNQFTIFSVDDINRVLEKDYKVKSGSYIYVYPYYINDGYEHDLNSNVQSIDIGTGSNSRHYTLDNSIVDPLMGKINCISDCIYYRK